MKLNRLLNSPYLIILLVGIYPALFYASNNWFMYRSDQLRILIFLTPILTGLIGLLGFSFINLFLKALTFWKALKITSRFKTEVKSFYFVFYCSIVIFFLLKNTINVLMPNFYLQIPVFLALSFIAWRVVAKAGYALLNVPIIIVILFTSLQWTTSYFSSASELNNDSWQVDKNDPASNVRFKLHDNVYYIIMESYQASEVLDKIYDFDNTSFETQLKENGFHIFNNFYSNYRNTLTSLSSTFAMQHHYYSIAKGQEDAVGARQLIGGISYNPVLDIFKNNNYQIQYLFDSEYSFIAGDNVDYAIPQRTPLKVFEIYQNETIDRIFSSIFSSYQHSDYRGRDLIAVTEDILYDEIKSRIRVAATSDKPYFTVVKLGLPGHFGELWTDIDPKRISQHTNKILKTNKIVLDLVNNIIENDPDSYTVLLGDHGAYRYRGTYSGKKSKNDNIRENGFTPSLVSEDIFHTFLGIRYSKAELKNNDIFSHVNIFRYIFSHLAMDTSILDTKIADESYIDEKTITAKDGKPLDAWITRAPEKN